MPNDANPRARKQKKVQLFRKVSHFYTRFPKRMVCASDNSTDRADNTPRKQRRKRKQAQNNQPERRRKKRARRSGKSGKSGKSGLIPGTVATYVVAQLSYACAGCGAPVAIQPDVRRPEENVVRAAGVCVVVCAACVQSTQLPCLP
jgi:hypothetical protein